MRPGGGKENDRGNGKNRNGSLALLVCPQWLSRKVSEKVQLSETAYILAQGNGGMPLSGLCPTCCLLTCSITIGALQQGGGGGNNTESLIREFTVDMEKVF